MTEEKQLVTIKDGIMYIEDRSLDFNFRVELEKFIKTINKKSKKLEEILSNKIKIDIGIQISMAKKQDDLTEGELDGDIQQT